MPIDDQTLERLATLSMLNLDKAYKKPLKEDLNNILELVESLASVETGSITPLQTPLDLAQRFREDRVCEIATPSRYQEQTRHKEKQLYLVPQVIE